jgi:catechol 2,3-dioxygenase-like lactoylglutathione lyase family enzyme
MINSLQHIGQGVWDIDVTYGFYRKYFGYKFKLNDLTIADEDMAQVIGSVETIRALMAANVKGGGVLELVEHKSSPKRPRSEDGGYGNYGILEVGYGVRRIEDVISDFQNRGIHMLTQVCEIPLIDGGCWRYAYLQDPDGLMLQLIEDIKPGRPQYRKPEVRGVVHVGVGVSNLERSKMFYESVLGFDKLLYEFQGHVPDMDQLIGSPLPMKLAILERSVPVGRSAGFLPAGAIKLFEVPEYEGQHIYQGRRWGDIGCMELGMDVSNLEAVIAKMKATGVEIYLPPVEIDMGSGSKGMIAYIHDPDGTIIELVEVKTVAWVSLSTIMRFVIPLLKAYDRITGYNKYVGFHSGQ